MGNKGVAVISAGDLSRVVVGLSELGDGTYGLATVDGGPSMAGSFGVSGVLVESADMTSAAAVTDVPATGQKLVILDVVVSVAAAMDVLFEEESSGTNLLRLYFSGAGGGQVTLRGKMKLATAGKRLMATASVAGAVAVLVTYRSEP